MDIVVTGMVGMGMVGMGMVGFGDRPQLMSHSRVGPYAGSCTHLIYIIHCEQSPAGVPSMHSAPLSVVVELPDVVVAEEVVTCCVVVDAGIVVVGEFAAHRPLTHAMLRVSVSRNTQIVCPSYSQSVIGLLPLKSIKPSSHSTTQFIAPGAQQSLHISPPNKGLDTSFRPVVYYKGWTAQAPKYFNILKTPCILRTA